MSKTNISPCTKSVSTRLAVLKRHELRRNIKCTSKPKIRFTCMCFPFRKTSISNELFSRLVSKQVFLPQQSLTSVFGMGTGGPSAIESLIELDISKQANVRVSEMKLKLFARTSDKILCSDTETNLSKEVQALGLLVSVS